jgi:threonine synthase
MKFVSTRGKIAPVSIREALEAGLASDGGLFVPEAFPKFTVSDFNGCNTLASVAKILLKPFFAEDETLSQALPEICDTSFNFPVPLTAVPKRTGDFILELYHGPTSAFKDVGARFLAASMEALAKAETVSKPRTVIVATSGDTGGAVAGAFFGRKGIDVVILYPRGRISPRQEKQLCAWGGNIRAFAVNGTFDDCQRIVKEALLDPNASRTWLSANSINLGRILPQMVYYAYSAVLLARKASGVQSSEDFPGVIIPSGNLGNSLAALWVRKVGLPLGPVHLAMNANRGVVDFLATGELNPAATIPTLANAMDVSKPSNLERIRNLFPVHADLQKQVSSESVSDDEIRAEIKTSEAEWGQVLCPHSAVAAVVRKRMDPSEQKRSWILVATAHPAKFETIVEPLIGHAVAVPPLLAQILAKPSVEIPMDATYAALKAHI